MNNKKNLLLLLTTFAVTLAAVAMTTTRQGLGQNNLFQKRQEATTPIREGNLHNSNSRGKKKLRDYSEGVEKIFPPPWVDLPDEHAPKSTEESLKASVCSADPVVIGVVNSKSSHFTEDGYSISTNYGLSIEEVLKNNVNAPLQLNRNITITRHGGTVELNGKTFRVLDKVFTPLELGGKYLLFLRFIPAIGAYQALNSESSFELSPNKVKRLTEQQLSYPFNYEDKPLAFVAQVRAALSNCAGGAK